MQKITPFLWFNDNAEEAMNFYLSVFKNSKAVKINRYGKGAPMPEGTVMTASFLIEDQEFVALNGGPYYTMTPGISFVINCTNQQEIDEYWNKLSEGGRIDQCGWVTDKFGVTWQVVPVALPEMLCDPDPLRSQRVMTAMLQMKKLDLNILQQAYNGN